MIINPYVAGGPVCQQPLFAGRTALLSASTGVLFREVPGSVSFVGPRRIGKTSILRRLRAETLARYPEALIVECSADEPVRAVEAPSFEGMLAQRLFNRMRAAGMDVADPSRWQGMTELLDAASAAGRPVYLFFDEFQGFVHRWNVGIEDWGKMRAWIQRSTGCPGLVIASLQPLSEFPPDLIGSGLPGAIQLVDQAVSWMNASEIQDLVNKPAAAHGIPLPPWASSAIFEQSGGHPFYAAHCAFALAGLILEGADLEDREPWFQRLDQYCRPHLRGQAARLEPHVANGALARLVADRFAPTDDETRAAADGMARAGWCRPNERLARPVGALFRRFLEEHFRAPNTQDEMASMAEIDRFSHALEDTELRLRDLLRARYRDRLGERWEEDALPRDIRARASRRGARGADILDAVSFGELFELLQALPDEDLFGGPGFSRVSIVTETVELRDGRNHLSHHVPIPRKLLREAQDVLQGLTTWLGRFVR